MVNGNSTQSQAEKFFGGWEVTVRNWDEASAKINEINGLRPKEGSIEWVWRGVCDASYPLHSALYRRILDSMGRSPREKDLVSIEEKMLNRSREEWRFDDLSALQTFAQIQHHGGPTRLLDVTFNPFVALWFAVQPRFAEDDLEKLHDLDGRLFAFIVPDDHIQLDREWGTRALPWGRGRSYKWKADTSYFWRPPSYNERIPAQNSAFIVSGVPRATSREYERRGFLYRRYRERVKPIRTEQGISQRDDVTRDDRLGEVSDLDAVEDELFKSSYRKSPEADDFWPIDQVRQSTSISMQMASLPKSLAAGFALGTGRSGRYATKTFTLRIKGHCKRDIREKLESRFGYKDSSIYPDIFGLASNVVNGLL